jgi:hypothetical protein
MRPSSAAARKPVSAPDTVHIPSSCTGFLQVEIVCTKFAHLHTAAEDGKVNGRGTCEALPAAQPGMSFELEEK